MARKHLALGLLCLALVQLVAAENVTLCWGRGTNGELGNGKPGPEGGDYGSSTPVVVSGGHSFSTVCSGFGHSCALESGQAWCWGVGGNGQLGTGSEDSSAVPVQVAGGHTFRAITCGRFHSCALDEEGRSWCWGIVATDPSGGDSTTSLVPVLAAEGQVFDFICAGYDHNCGLDAAGKAWCWGVNTAGQLGAGSDAQSSQAPLQVAGNHTFASLSCGIYHTCGLEPAPSSQAWCWGSSVFGELGSGAELDESAAGFENEPVAVAGGHAFAAISAGFSHTCGITLNSSAGGSLLCWGESPGNGQGLSPRTLLNEPTQPAWAADASLAFVAVSAADDSTCALDDAGNVWCFGGGSKYDPAYDSTVDAASAAPVKLAGEHTFLSLGTAHVLHMCAIAARPASGA